MHAVTERNWQRHITTAMKVNLSQPHQTKSVSEAGDIRPRCIPDNYVGDRHLSNWFKRNLGMVNLHLAYVDPERFIREELTRNKVKVIDGGTILLHFVGGQVTTLRFNELEITK